MLQLSIVVRVPVEIGMPRYDLGNISEKASVDGSLRSLLANCQIQPDRRATQM